MRDRLIHDYLGVDYKLVWDVVQNRIPRLRDQMAAILETAGIPDRARIERAGVFIVAVGDRKPSDEHRGVPCITHRARRGDG